MSITPELAKTKELAFLMTERFSMNPISCKHLNEAWREAFPDEVAVAKRMLALVEALEARDLTLSARDYHYDQQADRIQSLEKALEAAAQNSDGVAGMAEHYETTISMLKSRIAELEARTVKLPDYSETYTTGFASEIEHQVRKVLEMAGIQVIEGEQNNG